MSIDRRFANLRHSLAYLFNTRADIEFFGMFGPGNLGDEAMFHAARRLMPADRLMASKRRSRHRWLDALIRGRSRRHLIVGGGTLIHGGDTGWLDHVELRVKQGAELAFLGTGIAFSEAQISGRSPEYTRWSALLAGSRHVYLRGPMSAARARDMGADARVFGDLAFSLFDRDIVASAAGTRHAVGVNVGQCLGDQAAFEASAARFVGAIRRMGLDVVFYAVVPTDLPVTRRVMAAAGLDAATTPVECHYFDPQPFMRSVRTLRAFVGLKLHAAGIAMIAGVPSLMISYLGKCQDFVAPIGAEPALVSLPIDDDVLAAKFDALLRAPADFGFVERIAAVARAQRQSADALLAGMGA